MVPFNRKPKDEDSILEYIKYGVKLFMTSVLSFIGFCFHYFKSLTGILTWVLILGLLVSMKVYKKVYPELKHAREVEYNVLSHIKDSDFELNTDTRIFNNKGEQIGLINAGHFEYAKIQDISDKIQNGYIAVEDRRFKVHPGIDWISIVRAGLSLAKNSGDIKQGGSTITQQVVKNTYLTQEKTAMRKLTEILIAPEIEKKYTKADIMEFYCNTNFYGHRCYGVEAASKYYFGKSAKDVEWWEAALLVGLSNSPATYDPVKHPEAALAKRNEVLDKICREGYFEKESLAAFKAKPIDIVQEYVESTDENYQASYATYCATLELMEVNGFKFKYTFDSPEEYKTYSDDYTDKYSYYSDLIRSGGYDIYTSLDSEIQEKVQEDLNNGLSRFKDKTDDGRYALQGAAVVIDNRTNYVVAIVGGRDKDQFNRGFLAVRQPGSTIKPLLDYAPAFDLGIYSPASIIDDHKFEGGPSNSGGYHGNITIREALNRSLNTVAWQVLNEVGLRKGLSYLGNMQFKNISYTDNFAPAISIGGFTNGTRVVDMAKGYSTLANMGVYSDKTCLVSLVSTREGELVKKNKDTKVFEEDTAYIITDVLKGTLDKPYGTGNGLDIDGQQAAGKTGTTNGSKDAWFCGYTRYYTTAVWMGYDTPKPMRGIYGATYSGKIWQSIMTDLHKGLREWDWEKPSTVVDKTTDGITDLVSTLSEQRAIEEKHIRAAKRLESEAEKAVNVYENFYVDGVEAAYKVKELTKSTYDAVGKVEDSVVRKSMLDRVMEKEISLNDAVSKLQDALNIYEDALQESKEAEMKEKAKEAEEKAAQKELEFREKEFNLKAAEVKSLEYRDEKSDELYKELVNELKGLVDVENYNELRDKLYDCDKFINQLPSKDEWNILQESKRASEAESKALEESSRTDELNIISNRLELTQETSSQPRSSGSVAATRYHYDPDEHSGPGVGLTDPHKSGEGMVYGR